MKNSGLIIISLLIVLHSCSNSESAQTTDSPQSTVSQVEKDLRDIWVLSWMQGVDLDTISFPDGRPNLELNPIDTAALGFTGCNNLNASLYTSNDGALSFGPLATTRKYCLGIPEAQFLDYLTQTKTYKRDGLMLKLMNDSIHILTFKKVD